MYHVLEMSVLLLHIPKTVFKTVNCWTICKPGAYVMANTTSSYYFAAFIG